MIVLEFVQSLLIALVSGYLSFTNTIAASIEEFIASRETSSAYTLEAREDEITIPSNELTLLSKLYASTDSISRVLTENDTFNQAAQAVGSITPIPPPSNSVDTETLITRSLVNIFCEYKTNTFTRTTTGSGFFITPSGVILTNAHVAQFLLLESLPEKEGKTECVIRTGNPALPRFQAELLFISPSWIFKNADLITSEHPQGTGEYDYALLYITESLTHDPLPQTFDALPLYTDFLSKKYNGTNVLTAGYPAEKLMREGPKAELIPKTDVTQIEELYTFGSNYADIFSVSNSTVGEHGASGGPVYKEGSGTIGLIVTKGDEDREGKKSLRALTLSYIDRTITEETGFSLIQNAQGDLPYRGSIFKEVLQPHLTKLLEEEM